MHCMTYLDPYSIASVPSYYRTFEYRLHHSTIISDGFSSLRFSSPNASVMSYVISKMFRSLESDILFSSCVRSTSAPQVPSKFGPPGLPETPFILR